MRDRILRRCRLPSGIAAIILLTVLVSARGAEDTAYAQRSGATLPAYPWKLSANHRYLVDQHNKPFLIVGDSPQGLVCMLSEAGAERYFADRQAHGFNTAGWIDAACAGSDFPANKSASTYDGILPFTGFVTGPPDYGALLSYDDLLPFTRYAREEMDHTGLRSLEAERSLLCAARRHG